MDDNVRPFGVITGDKPVPAVDELPSNVYFIEDIDGVEHLSEGFLIFTGQHIAVMRDAGSGAIPVLVVPLARVRVAGLVDQDELDTVD